MKLTGLKALVTSGPTREALDPVRYISNYSSGKQGVAIAKALAAAGVEITLVTGPVAALPPMPGIRVVPIESARDMWAACEASLPVQIAICVAAVADWRPAEYQEQKLKKQPGQEAFTLTLVKNPDILANLSQHPTHRPTLVIGFAAETEDLLANARRKLAAKGCDALLVNHIRVLGQDHTQLTWVTATEAEAWPEMPKEAVGEKLVEYITSVNPVRR